MPSVRTNSDCAGSRGRVEELAKDVDRRLGQVHGAAASDLGGRDAWAFVIHLDDLTLDAQSAPVEIDIPDPQGKELAQAAMGPERQMHERLELRGHRVREAFGVVEGQERAFGAVGLAGAADLAGVSDQQFVGDGGVEDGS